MHNCSATAELLIDDDDMICRPRQAGARKGGGGGEDEVQDSARDKLDKAISKIKKRFGLDKPVAEILEEKVEELPMVESGARPEKLDTTFNDDEDADDDAGAGGGGGGDDAGAGSMGIIRDNLMSSLTIDDYMHYRVMPVGAHVERTAPWLALRLQVIEICIFAINSSGAVLVGVSQDFVPYVAITVAVAAVLNSYLEFSRLAKQVEAYN